MRAYFVRKQTIDILFAWAVSEAHAVATAGLMTEANLRSVDARAVRRADARPGTPFPLG